MSCTCVSGMNLEMSMVGQNIFGAYVVGSLCSSLVRTVTNQSCRYSPNLSSVSTWSRSQLKRILRRAFVFPVDSSLCPMFSSILSQLNDRPCICGSHTFCSPGNIKIT